MLQMKYKTCIVFCGSAIREFSEMKVNIVGLVRGGGTEGERGDRMIHIQEIWVINI